MHKRRGFVEFLSLFQLIIGSFISPFLIYLFIHWIGLVRTNNLITGEAFVYNINQFRATFSVSRPRRGCTTKGVPKKGALTGSDSNAFDKRFYTSPTPIPVAQRLESHKPIKPLLKTVTVHAASRKIVHPRKMRVQPLPNQLGELVVEFRSNPSTSPTHSQYDVLIIFGQRWPLPLLLLFKIEPGSHNFAYERCTLRSFSNCCLSVMMQAFARLSSSYDHVRHFSGRHPHRSCAAPVLTTEPYYHRP